ncbi:hypothetical protein Tco_0400682 [Tanacetum coccineum]
MLVAKRPHPDPLNIPFDGDAHNTIEYRSTNEYGSASSLNKTTDIGRKKIIIRESTHINGDNVTTQARSCSDGRVYQSRDPYSYTSSLLNDKEHGPIPYTKHPSLLSKHGPLIHDMATQQMTTSASIPSHVSPGQSPPSPLPVAQNAFGSFNRTQVGHSGSAAIPGHEAILPHAFNAMTL